MNHVCKFCKQTEEVNHFVGFHAYGSSEICDYCAGTYGCDCGCVKKPTIPRVDLDVLVLSLQLGASMTVALDRAKVTYEEDEDEYEDEF